MTSFIQTLHGKDYQTPTEEHFRFNLFNQNKLRNAMHNGRFYKGEFNYTLEVNYFSDMVRLQKLKGEFGILTSFSLF